MALEHAILVSLAERPATGYEIGRQFERSIGHFWRATHQQIYRTLKKLHADGLVTYRDIPQDGRPDKKVYSVSDSGRQVLREWVSSPTPLHPLRSDLGVKLRGAEHGDLAAVVGELKAHRDAAQAQYAMYRGFEREYTAPDSLTGRRLHQYLVLRGGLTMAKATVDWCDETLAGLQRELDAAGVPAPHSPEDPVPR